MSNFPKLVADELNRAHGSHAAIQSFHEGLAVILEEYREFEIEIFKKDPIASDILKELTHLAAMCQRFAEDTKLIDTLYKPARIPFINRQSVNIDTTIEHGKAQLIVLVSCSKCGYADWMTQPIMADDRAEYLSGLAKAALNGWFVGSNAERCLCPDCARK